MRIAVLGAGITGLSLGWKLKQRHGDDIDLRIFDQAARPGGWIQTIHQDGFLFELGPRSCRPYGHGVATLTLIQELGLENEVIFAAPAARSRYLWHQGKLRRMPTGLLSLASSPWLWPMAASLFKEPWRPSSAASDETIEQFFLRRLGQQLTYSLIDALVSGIYAGDISKLSVRSCFPQWHQWEKDYRSLIRGAWQQRRGKVEDPFIQHAQRQGIFTLRRGMESLVHALAKALHDQLKLEKKVLHIQPAEEKIRVVFADGEEFVADEVYSTLPHESVERNSLFVVSVGYETHVLPYEGFGYLIPKQEKQKILGVVWDSSAFPQQNRDPQETRLTVMLKADQEIDKAKEIALESLRQHLGIRQKPKTVHLHQAWQAIPQYYVGHYERTAEIRRISAQKMKNLYLVGTSFDGVSVNDAVAVSSFQ